MSELLDIIKSNKSVATVAVCIMGGFSMWVSKGQTGIGWAILGLLFIWMD